MSKFLQRIEKGYKPELNPSRVAPEAAVGRSALDYLRGGFSDTTAHGTSLEATNLLKDIGAMVDSHFDGSPKTMANSLLDSSPIKGKTITEGDSITLAVLRGLEVPDVPGEDGATHEEVEELRNTLAARIAAAHEYIGEERVGVSDLNDLASQLNQGRPWQNNPTYERILKITESTAYQAATYAPPTPTGPSIRQRAVSFVGKHVTRENLGAVTTGALEQTFGRADRGLARAGKWIKEKGPQYKNQIVQEVTSSPIGGLLARATETAVEAARRRSTSVRRQELDNGTRLETTINALRAELHQTIRGRQFEPARAQPLTKREVVSGLAGAVAIGAGSRLFAEVAKSGLAVLLGPVGVALAGAGGAASSAVRRTAEIGKTGLSGAMTEEFWQGKSSMSVKRKAFEVLRSAGSGTEVAAGQTAVRAVEKLQELTDRRFSKYIRSAVDEAATTLAREGWAGIGNDQLSSSDQPHITENERLFQAAAKQVLFFRKLSRSRQMGYADLWERRSTDPDSPFVNEPRKDFAARIDLVATRYLESSSKLIVQLKNQGMEKEASSLIDVLASAKRSKAEMAALQGAFVLGASGMAALKSAVAFELVGAITDQIRLESPVSKPLAQGGTARPTLTPQPTFTPTSTGASAAAPITPMATATETPIPTGTPTSVPTSTVVPPTATPSSTATVVPPTETPISTGTSTATTVPTGTPSATATPGITPTSTETPVPTATSTPVPSATPVPQPSATATPAPTAPTPIPETPKVPEPVPPVSVPKPEEPPTSPPEAENPFGETRYKSPKSDDILNSAKEYAKAASEGKEVPEAVQPVAFEEIEINRTAGHSVLEHLKNKGYEDIKLWGKEGSQIWGGMLQANIDNSTLWNKAFSMANWAANNGYGSASLDVFKELGFDAQAGMFNLDAVNTLVAKAQEGDIDSIKKLQAIWHWLPAKAKVKIPFPSA